MTGEEITVTYKWTAKPGKGAELKAMYENVVKEAKANEPGAYRFEVYEVQGSEDLIIVDIFRDSDALGEHLGGTAAKHFPKLLEIAVPGPFFFCGDVPDELVQIASGMNMGAIFATRAFGFSRGPSEMS
ncbi:antibiotic biosynthesis monooxygenase [Methanolobus sp. ZRKC2]|uniref:putative quinol monooxygenase n=1 Tax=Methanolobus sp. ZRKC2 TaxID=3125783 RepID=UPI0032477E76